MARELSAVVTRAMTQPSTCAVRTKWSGEWEEIGPDVVVALAMTSLTSCAASPTGWLDCTHRVDSTPGAVEMIVLTFRVLCAVTTKSSPGLEGPSLGAVVNEAIIDSRRYVSCIHLFQKRLSWCNYTMTERNCGSSKSYNIIKLLRYET